MASRKILIYRFFFIPLHIETKIQKTMGYTHYWNFHKVENGKEIVCSAAEIENGKEKFKNAVELFRKCLDYMGGKTCYPNWGDDAFDRVVPMKLAGGNGNGTPKITDTIVCFNGYGKESCETCYLELNYKGFLGSNFCKTNREPYDTAVWVCLLCFKYYFGENMGLSSDGDDEEHRYPEQVFNAVIQTM